MVLSSLAKMAAPLARLMLVSTLTRFDLPLIAKKSDLKMLVVVAFCPVFAGFTNLGQNIASSVQFAVRDTQAQPYYEMSVRCVHNRNDTAH